MKQNVLLIILIFAIVGIGVIWYLNSQREEMNADSLTEVARITTNDERVRRILAAVELIRSVNLDTSIFTRDILRKLVDESVDITSGSPINRNNPFLEPSEVVLPIFDEIENEEDSE